MGVDIVQLGGGTNETVPKQSLADLAKPDFHTYHIPQPGMSVWLMNIKPGVRVFPWWNFQTGYDEDVLALHRLWAITNEQSLFDCLFLSQFFKFARQNLYAIFSGNIRNQGWKDLKETDRNIFSKGQSCIYRLDGEYDGKLNINWVPFYSAQSLVKDPDFGSLWRLFGAGAPESEANSLCLFSLSNPRDLPQVIQILIDKEANRSVKLLDIVDWFGLYSSPLEPRFASCAVVYSKKNEVISALENLQESFRKVFEQSQAELLNDIRPRVAIRIVSRHVVL